MSSSLATRILSSAFIVSFIVLHLFFPCRADVGTAASYSPPYLPSKCYGTEATEFPSSNLFAAAGDGIWDNGAACGRQYLVRCISAEQPRTCIPDQSIQIKIVDYAATAVSAASASGTTLVLSDKAFGSIANTTAILINIEFQQV
ncbi:EG45-like domain containing protein [Arachis hypogaea]|uniref:EG45-like domain containing protein n=1 Tax=Arachis hypogaea TaxID=3818 RepID=UPI000DECA924|nr:EG45-like domain containing protein [Arachis hypogaea]QHO51370.1 EG45-like domain containing protein [Arachis hypogaea]